MSPMFKSFEFSSSSSSSHSEMSSPSPDESSYDASCLGNITCDISATSSEVFWGQTYTWYRSENKAHRRRRELEDEGSVIHYMDSLRELHPDFIFDQPSLINDVFQDRSEEGGLILSFEDETDDERSSGYIGSEERSQSRPSSSTALNEADITFISTKLYRQALGKRRRHFTASSSSSSYSTNTSTPQRVSSPNASYESLLTNLLLPNAGQKGPPLPAAP
ncbi:Uncharacterized protein FKW44_004368 [Caligus rogercresseyi]|uniref:Uncharacterized protein n=1 Tax=Caligus rogercresseyi TaxID=217165 RepID=A0A7T8HLH9_CALRO|nr:Uncharacterized protein FKW44_004368 [Caligus rogercresseyi]